MHMTPIEGGGGGGGGGGTSINDISGRAIILESQKSKAVNGSVCLVPSYL